MISQDGAMYTLYRVHPFSSPDEWPAWLHTANSEVFFECSFSNAFMALWTLAVCTVNCNFYRSQSVKAAKRAGARIQPCLTVIKFGTVVHENKSPTCSNQLKLIKWVIRASCFLINDIIRGRFYLPKLHKLQRRASNNDLLLLSGEELFLFCDSNEPK